MKILYLTGIASNHRTGLFHSILDRMKWLDNQDVSYELISIVEVDSKFSLWIKKMLKMPLAYKKEKCNKEIIDGVEIRYIYIKKTLINKLFEFIAPEYYFTRKIKQNINLAIDRFTLVHAHWVYPHGLYGKIIGSCLNIPYVVTGHGSDIHTLPYKNPIKKRLTKRVLRESDCSFFVSKALEDKAKKELAIGKRSAITYNGVSVEYKINEGDSKKDNVLKIGFIGNLDKTKGADFLPGIFYEISRLCNLPLEFHIVGNGVFYKELDEYFSSNQSLKVKMHGKISRENTLKVIELMDLIVIPSRNEGFGIVAIEALICGTKVVAANVGGLPEILKPLGLVFETQLNESSIKEFAKFSLSILTNDKINGRILKRRGKEFDFNKSMKVELDMYTKILQDEESKSA